MVKKMLNLQDLVIRQLGKIQIISVYGDSYADGYCIKEQNQRLLVYRYICISSHVFKHIHRRSISVYSSYGALLEQ